MTRIRESAGDPDNLRGSQATPASTTHSVGSADASVDPGLRRAEAGMKRRRFLQSILAGGIAAPLAAGAARAAAPVRGTGDLGVIIERATGSALIVETTGRSVLGRIEGLGDMSHASLVFSRDERFAYVFGRDGGLTKIDVLDMRIVKRIIQAGNAIGGAISDDGTLVAVSNYDPGGVRVFDAATLEPLCEIPAEVAGAPKRSKTVGLVDAPGRRFVYTLYDAGEIWVADFSKGNIAAPILSKFPGIGKLPYDASITTDGRHYIAGLFGEDGLVHLDMWAKDAKPRRVLEGYGKGDQQLPVFKMPHLEGWGQIDDRFLLPAVGRHELLAVEVSTFRDLGRVATHGQPIFAVVQPGSPRVWVNFAHPKNDTVQIIDALTLRVVHELKPGPAVLHLEFLPRGNEVWISVRDTDRVEVYDTATFRKLAELPAMKPSGIFFTPRAHRIGQ